MKSGFFWSVRVGFNLFLSLAVILLIAGLIAVALQKANPLSPEKIDRNSAARQEYDEHQDAVQPINEYWAERHGKMNEEMDALRAENERLLELLNQHGIPLPANDR